MIANNYQYFNYIHKWDLHCIYLFTVAPFVCRMWLTNFTYYENDILNLKHMLFSITIITSEYTSVFGAFVDTDTGEYYDISITKHT